MTVKRSESELIMKKVITLRTTAEILADLNEEVKTMNEENALERTENVSKLLTEYAKSSTFETYSTWAHTTHPIQTAVTEEKFPVKAVKADKDGHWSVSDAFKTIDLMAFIKFCQQRDYSKDKITVASDINTRMSALSVLTAADKTRSLTNDNAEINRIIRYYKRSTDCPVNLSEISSSGTLSKTKFKAVINSVLRGILPEYVVNVNGEEVKKPVECNSAVLAYYIEAFSKGSSKLNTIDLVSGKAFEKLILQMLHLIVTESTARINTKTAEDAYKNGTTLKEKEATNKEEKPAPEQSADSK